MRTSQVRYLLMGGQACVLYGAAEFSRDIDLVIMIDEENHLRLTEALADLRAEVIAVPDFSEALLARGHAVHFRSQHPEATGLRIDLMATMRGVDEFHDLWDRRTTVELDGVGNIELLSLPDLVLAKKTQRDKDWPMIRRLVEANYFSNRDAPSDEQITFWLREMRTASLLIDVVSNHPKLAESEKVNRPLLASALSKNENELAAFLLDEEERERRADRDYWSPLKRELAEMRRRRRQE